MAGFALSEGDRAAALDFLGWLSEGVTASSELVDGKEGAESLMGR